MEITCERCARGHEIADDRIPPFGARLRCSGCGQLFELPAQDNGVRVRVRVGGRRGRGGGADDLPDLVVVTREGAVAPVVGHTGVSPAADPPAPDEVGPFAETVSPGEGSADDNGKPAPDPEVVPVGEPEAAEPPDPHRLARMLLTDVVYGDPERFEAARREGRVLVAFSSEIDRAWTFYRQRVGDDVARTTPHFRAALLEVLGGDEPLDE